MVRVEGLCQVTPRCAVDANHVSLSRGIHGQIAHSKSPEAKLTPKLRR